MELISRNMTKKLNFYKNRILLIPKALAFTLLILNFETHCILNIYISIFISILPEIVLPILKAIFVKWAHRALPQNIK